MATKQREAAQKPQPKTEAKAEEKEPKQPRVLLGKPDEGVRAHPSYDHPGEFYAVEAGTRRRVFSGYHTVATIRELCRKAGFKFLGVVEVRGKGKGLGYNKDSVTKAVTEFGRAQRERKPREKATEPAKEPAAKAS